uniref:Splicing regulatory glutamine/lysine-rich protein 1 n=1 Tax=Malurus cyaneus samueli TaxID=2593467 RepID=A0A8C5X5P5_9PASS
KFASLLSVFCACVFQLGVSLGTLGAIPAAALDPNITALGEIPQPPIMGNVDPSKIDEIRRTVYVGNLNSQTTTADQLLEFFKQVGEVKFVRMAGDETQPTRFAFVEFADQNSVPRALAFNGVMFGDRPLKINHSNNAIVKPPEMTPQAAAKELEEVMKRVREAQSFISAAIEPGKYIVAFSDTGEGYPKVFSMCWGKKKKIIKILFMQQSIGIKRFISLCFVFRYMFTECFQKCKFNIKSVLNDGTFKV